MISLSVLQKERWNALPEPEQRRMMHYVLDDFRRSNLVVTGHGLVGYALGRYKTIGELDVKSEAALAIAGGYGLRRPEIKEAAHA